MKYIIIDCFNFTLSAAFTVYNKGTEEDKTEILFGLISRMLNKLKRSFPGYKFFGVWDTYGGTDFRKEIDPLYKANRDHSKYDFKVIESTKSVYEQNEVVNVIVPKCEADDAIFTLCQILKEKDSKSEVVIVSRDHDMIQVVQKGFADKIWDNVSKKYMEVPDYSIVDMKSLVGDKSDGVSGVPKIGEKTALKILNGELNLTEYQKEIFEKCKNIIDATRNPRFVENYNYIISTYKDILENELGY